MRPPPPQPESSAGYLDDCVEAFEAILARDGRADLAAFLPEAGHPLYRAVLVELIRVELEHGWGNGRPQPLEEYHRRFPAAFENGADVQAMAFEEYRLRRQAGQDPSPAEYERVYGTDARDWPPQRLQIADCRSQIEKKTSGSPSQSAICNLQSAISLEEAAHAYREFRLFQDSAALEADSWLKSLAGSGATHARVFGDLHRADPAAADRLAAGLVRMPEVGTEFLGFRLLAELGRGAFGRVFLAEQAALASRLVALKVSPDAGGESQKLAQLQHTHIVPVYSLHRADPLQAVCMPFFGALTLADVLRDLLARPSLPQSGVELLSTLNDRPQTVASGQWSVVSGEKKNEAGREKQAGPSAPATGHRPLANVREKLQGLSYVEAVLWLGGCLADGLGHAHEHGIVHRDLKPANVLLTDEGQPMLLDFNLSEDVKGRSSASAAMVGGTLPYMAPEHLEAFRGRPRNIDGRSDLFSLGILLYELLAGHSPFPRTQPSSAADVDAVVARLIDDRQMLPALARQWNRDVSPAVDSILRHCLEAEPANRYQSARQLQEDLQRQLEHLPLKYAADPSLRERLSKLRRRSPKLLGRILIGMALLLTTVATTLGIRAYREKQRADRERETEEARAENLARNQEAQDAREKERKEIVEATFLLHTEQDHRQRERGLALCRRVLAQYAVLADGGWRAHPRFDPLGGEERAALEEDFGEILLLLARFADREGSRQAALAYNGQAERCFAADKLPPAVWGQRAELLEKQGKKTEADRYRRLAGERPLQTARDFYLAARDRVFARRFHAALPLLEEATSRDPRSYWARYLLGTCYDGLGDNAEALKCYEVCVSLAPTFHASYFHRGLVFLRQRNFKRACADFDRAIALQRDHAYSYINRALARAGLKRYREAADDLTQALNLDSTPRLYLLRGRFRRAGGDFRGAEQDEAEGMRQQAHDATSWNAQGHMYLSRRRGVLLEAFDNTLALAAFDAGLALDPADLACLNSKAYVLSERLLQPRRSLAVVNDIVRLYPDYTQGRSGRGVLLARLGDRAAALRDARVALDPLRSREPLVVYQAGCIYALTSRQNPADAVSAFPLLHEALRRGFGADFLATDTDLRPLHPLPEFQRLKALADNLNRPPSSLPPPR